MKPVRQFFAVMIIIFIALPLLFGMTWAVGITRAVVSPEFISEMPGEIIQESRLIMDEMVQLGKTDDPSLDRETRAWLRALASVDRTPGEILDASGITAWLEGELDQSLKQVSAILRGQSQAIPVTLDMMPLKAALQSPVMRTWIKNVVSRLPECGEEGVAEWRRFLESPGRHDRLPACRPGVEISESVVALAIDRAVRDMPDQVEMMEDVEIHPRGVDIARMVSSVTFFLFLIPGIVILLTSLMGAGSKSSFFRWAGVTTMLGGGLAMLTAMAARNAADWGAWIPRMDIGEWNYTPIEAMTIERMGRLWDILGAHIVEPVVKLAGGVCVVGLLIFALAYAFNSSPQAPARSAASSEPAVPQPDYAKTKESESLPE